MPVDLLDLLEPLELEARVLLHSFSDSLGVVAREAACEEVRCVCSQ